VQVRSSQMLRVALHAALQVGNTLNAGQLGGGAEGIRVESLHRFTELKVVPRLSADTKRKGWDILNSDFFAFSCTTLS
jgi:hypothetical protein